MKLATYKYNQRYDTRNTNENKKIKFNTEGIIKIPYINDNTDRRIKKYLNENNLNLKIVHTATKKINHLTKPKNNELNENKKCNCDFCSYTGGKLKCTEKNIVYKYECKLCKMIYIGKTDCMIKNRHSLHKHHFRHKNRNSPMFEHHCNYHPERLINIEKSWKDYTIDIIRRNHDPVNNAISEAIEIQRNIPILINRKHELQYFLE